MTQTFPFEIEDIAPSRDAVFENQGIPAGQAVSAEVEALHGQAVDLLREVADPAGIQADISQSDFGDLYSGEGLNEPVTPVGEIFPRASFLALFAVTLGRRTSEKIQDLFAANDFALGSMFDAVASAAADHLAEVMERRTAARHGESGRADASTHVLRYSPGYCGWHISGQRKLFGFLRPESIGITLRESYLMDPLKSVSGVLIAGPAEIHTFPDAYPFCSACQSRGCQARMRLLQSG